MFRLTEIVKVLLTINVLFYLGSAFVGDVSYQLFAMYFPLNDNFFPWQLVTHMFMHNPANIHHILTNMMFLVFMGPSLEIILGKNKFIFLYFSAGIAATLFTLIFQYINYNIGYSAILDAGYSSEEIQSFLVSESYPTALLETIKESTINKVFRSFFTSSVGASGAIFGIAAAFARIFPNQPIYLLFVPFGIKAKYLIGAYFAFQIYAAVTEGYLSPESNVDYLAHIGGAIVGFVIVHIWIKKGILKG